MAAKPRGAAGGNQLLISFVLAMQCMSTLAIVRRETGGCTWPLGMLVYMNALAYGVCLEMFQVGRMWWPNRIEYSRR